MPTSIPISDIHPCLEHCLLLDEATKVQLSSQMKSMNDSATASIQTLIRTLDTDALASLLDIAMKEAIERKDENIIRQLDQWIKTAKQKLNVTEESIERGNIDTEFIEALNQLP